jgi:hypothetical protein
LIEFKVTRNFSKGLSIDLLHFTNQWLNHKGDTDVDGFAHFLNSKGLTHGKVMTSLASKILFLNNPWEVIPIDRQAKKALDHKSDNCYSNFKPKLEDYRISKSKFFTDTFKIVQPFLKIVEKPFEKEIENISIIRENRLLDKLLWTAGI